MLSHYKKTMKTLFILFILLMPIAAFAQELDSPIIDKFTNDTTYSTSGAFVANDNNSGEYLMVYFSRIRNDYFLNLRMQVAGGNHNVFNVNNGGKILVKLEDNTVVNLANNSNVQASSSKGYWFANLVIPFSEDDRKKMSGSNFTAIRVMADNQNFDFGITAKEGLVMEKMLLIITTLENYN